MGEGLYCLYVRDGLYGSRTPGLTLVRFYNDMSRFELGRRLPSDRIDVRNRSGGLVSSDLVPAGSILAGE